MAAGLTAALAGLSTSTLIILVRVCIKIRLLQVLLTSTRGISAQATAIRLCTRLARLGIRPGGGIFRACTLLWWMAARAALVWRLKGPRPSGVCRKVVAGIACPNLASCIGYRSRQILATAPWSVLAGLDTMALSSSNYGNAEESMLELTNDEKYALNLVYLKTQVQAIRYGGAHHLSYKKTGISTASWRGSLVSELSCPTPRAAAAFRYLMANNRYYKALYGQHKALLQSRASLNSCVPGLIGLSATEME